MRSHCNEWRTKMISFQYSFYRRRSLFVNDCRLGFSLGKENNCLARENNPRGFNVLDMARHTNV